MPCILVESGLFIVPPSSLTRSMPLSSITRCPDGAKRRCPLIEHEQRQAKVTGHGAHRGNRGRRPVSAKLTERYDVPDNYTVGIMNEVPLEALVPILKLLILCKGQPKN